MTDLACSADVTVTITTDRAEVGEDDSAVVVGRDLVLVNSVDITFGGIDIGVSDTLALVPFSPITANLSSPRFSPTMTRIPASANRHSLTLRHSFKLDSVMFGGAYASRQPPVDLLERRSGE